jgi:hypothetical protein
MFKKMTVLAMAVGIVAAFALPSAASANWKHVKNGVASPIQTDVTLGLTGQARFQSQLGGVECQVTSEVTFEAGTTTGKAKTFDPHPVDETANCKGTGGLAGCQIHNLDPTSLPWTIHTAGVNTITITIGQIHSTSTGFFCPVSSITLEPGTVTATTDSGAVEEANLSGTLQSLIGGSETQVHVGGKLLVEDPNKNTYEV